MSTDRESGQDRKGFAGLSSMVSDVDEAVAKAERARVETARSQAAPAPRVEPTPAPAPRSPDRSPVVPTIVWIGIAVVAFAAFLIFANSPPNQRSASSYSASTQHTPPPSSLSQADVRSPPPAPSRPSEERPPVGSGNVLSVAQIRYCLAEDIRLEASKAVVSSYDDAAVDRFNAYVSDYNSRCGQFRYRRGTLESARADVERIRASLQDEGRLRFAAVGRPMGQPPRPQSSGELAEIQQRLAVLGYDPGPADGFMGPRTQAAISQFQSDFDLAVTGEPSADLLARLRTMRQAPGTFDSVPRRSEVRPVPPSASTLSEAAPPVTVAQPAPTRSAEPVTRRLTANEESSLESACSTAKYSQGPAAYNACRTAKLMELAAQGPAPDLSRLNQAERSSIDSSCSTAKYSGGPAQYNACLSRQLAELRVQGSRPDLSSLNAAELSSIESSCSTAKYSQGPGPYNACLRSKLQELQQQGPRPDLSSLSTAEVSSIESACSTAKYSQGPGPYNACLSRQLAALKLQGGRPDLSSLNSAELTSIESACSMAKYSQGPAAYNSCLSRQLAQLGRR